MNEMKPIHDMIPILYQWLLAKYTIVKSFAFWKVSVNLCNFRIPVYKGVPLPWMKWHTFMKWYPSFTNDCRPSIRVWKVSLSETWELNCTTLGFLFVREFPSHEWNETHPWNDTHLLPMTADHVYECKKFRILKSVKLYNDAHPWNYSHPSIVTAG